MKAAVLNKLGTSPQYQDFDEPIIEENQLLVNVKFSSIKNLDKLRASGTHYASYKETPVIVGFDGVGELENGDLVYAQGLTGMLAEKAVIDKRKYTILPNGIDCVSASALPNAVMGSALALEKGGMKTGYNVLINGATGVTGKLAVQLAKYYNASKIIITGRNQLVLDELHKLGADVSINLTDKEDQIIENLSELHQLQPVDLIIDYLWGRPVELIIKSLNSYGATDAHKTTLVTVGDMAGKSINLESGFLRSNNFSIIGSGLGSLSHADMLRYNIEVLPKMFDLLAKKIINIDTLVDNLNNIENAWNMAIPNGKRLVIKI